MKQNKIRVKRISSLKSIAFFHEKFCVFLSDKQHTDKVPELNFWGSWTSLKQTFIALTF